ncbi:hypothetical protein FALCPG4_000839 [Fusarium falciforme]
MIQRDLFCIGFTVRESPSSPVSDDRRGLVGWEDETAHSPLLEHSGKEGTRGERGTPPRSWPRLAIPPKEHGPACGMADGGPRAQSLRMRPAYRTVAAVTYMHG